MTYLLSLWVGGSRGGIEVAVLSVVLGGATGSEWWDTDDLPVEVERTDGVSSKKFRAN